MNATKVTEISLTEETHKDLVENVLTCVTARNYNNIIPSSFVTCGSFFAFVCAYYCLLTK